MTNEGTIDRAVRIIAGLAILSLAFVGPQSPLGYIASCRWPPACSDSARLQAPRPEHRAEEEVAQISAPQAAASARRPGWNGSRCRGTRRSPRSTHRPGRARRAPRRAPPGHPHAGEDGEPAGALAAARAGQAADDGERAAGAWLAVPHDGPVSGWCRWRSR